MVTQAVKLGTSHSDLGIILPYFFVEYLTCVFRELCYRFYAGRVENNLQLFEAFYPSLVCVTVTACDVYTVCMRSTLRINAIDVYYFSTKTRDFKIYQPKDLRYLIALSYYKHPGMRCERLGSLFT